MDTEKINEVTMAHPALVGIVEGSLALLVGIAVSIVPLRYLAKVCGKAAAKELIKSL